MWEIPKDDLGWIRAKPVCEFLRDGQVVKLAFTREGLLLNPIMAEGQLVFSSIPGAKTVTSVSTTLDVSHNDLFWFSSPFTIGLVLFV